MRLAYISVLWGHTSRPGWTRGAKRKAFLPSIRNSRGTVEKYPLNLKALIDEMPPENRDLVRMNLQLFCSRRPQPKNRTSRVSPTRPDPMLN
jgi:hypothetical protein